MVKKEEKKKSIVTVGKRKRAIARATFKKGTGSVMINSIPIETFGSEITRLKIEEPLMILGDAVKKFDIRVNVAGGGKIGQAEATRQAIGKGLSQLLGEEARKKLLEYDRSLLVYDPRRTEPHKPPHSSWGPRRYKQRSKR